MEAISKPCETRPRSWSQFIQSKRTFRSWSHGATVCVPIHPVVTKKVAGSRYLRRIGAAVSKLLA